MQLLRSIGIDYGYQKIIQRKIFELIYSTIFLKSLKNYYSENFYANTNKFKKYLIYVYITHVNTKVSDKIYPTITDFVGKDPTKWTKEKMFVAFFGLTFRETSFNNVSVFSAVLLKNIN